MATTKQKKIAHLIVENIKLDKPLNGGQMLEKVGYSPNLVKQPGRVIESDGVKDELALLGFSVAEADKTVANLLKNAEKEETKIKAAQEIYKRLSAYAPEKSVNLNVNRTDSSRLDAIIAHIEQQLDEPEGTTLGT